MVKNIIDYFKSSYQELLKVTWPKRDRAIRLTVLVVISIIVATLITTAIDYGLSAMIDIILKKT